MARFLLVFGILQYSWIDGYGTTNDKKLEDARRQLHGFNAFAYNSFADITKFLEKLAFVYPDEVQLQQVGKSSQGRPIKLVRISLTPITKSKNPIVFIDAGIHGNEWVAPAMAMYIIHRLVFEFSDTQRGGALDALDWLILPVVNPDGYEFTRASEENRLWKKTRSRSNRSDCIGVDGNRNFDCQWKQIGFCFTDDYSGPRPFSEPETRIVSNIIRFNKERLKLYVSLQAYGQYLLYPFGHKSSATPGNLRKLKVLADFVSHAVNTSGGDPFECMSAATKFKSAGRSDDYAWYQGVPYSYTMMLTKGHEYTFPEDLLEVVLPQFFVGFNVFALQIRLEFVEKVVIEH